MSLAPASPVFPDSFATAYQALHNGVVKIKTEEAAELVPCMPPGSSMELTCGPMRLDEGPLSHSESISSCSDAVAAGNESGNPSSALSNGSKLSIGSQQDLIEFSRLTSDRQACLINPPQSSSHAASMKFIPDTPGPSLSTQPSLLTNSIASTHPPAANATTAPSWSAPLPNVPLPGTQVPNPLLSNLLPNPLSQLPFQLLNTCGNVLALQGAAASLNQAALKPEPAVCVDAQFAQLLAGQMKRKGKGGRQPATDPRLDPSIDPKKAKRILANRQSAAKSKLKQKLFVEGLKQRHTLMAFQRQTLSQEVSRLSSLCLGLEAENEVLESSIKAIANLGCQQPTMPSLPSSVEPAMVPSSEPSPAPASAPPCSSMPSQWTQTQAAAANASWWMPNMWPFQQQANFRPGCT